MTEDVTSTEMVTASRNGSTVGIGQIDATRNRSHATGHWVAPPRLPLMFGTAATNTLPGKASTNALVSVMGVALELSSRDAQRADATKSNLGRIEALADTRLLKDLQRCVGGIAVRETLLAGDGILANGVDERACFRRHHKCAECTQLLLAGTVAPASDTLEAPGKAVTLPPVRVVPVSLGLATARSGGRLSVSATPVSATLAVLVTVTISSVRSPTLTGEVAKVLLMLGPGTTFSVVCPGVDWSRPGWWSRCLQG